MYNNYTVKNTNYQKKTKHQPKWSAREFLEDMNWDKLDSTVEDDDFDFYEGPYFIKDAFGRLRAG